jgi:thiol-disulfide isomerase/thioredoxin
MSHTLLSRTALGAALLMVGTASFALQFKPFSDDALAAAQRAGQPVTVQFQADWCPVCRAQTAVLKQLQAEPGLRRMTVLVASFDDDWELRQRMNVRATGVLVVFRGKQEKARVVGDTAADRIRTVLKSAL